MRVTPQAVFWMLILASAAFPFVFRSRIWVRVLAVIVLLFFAGVAWTGVQTSTRLAMEMARRDGQVTNQDFLNGAMAATRVADRNGTLFVGVVFALTLLALLPGRPK